MCTERALHQRTRTRAWLTLDECRAGKLCYSDAVLAGPWMVGRDDQYQPVGEKRLDDKAIWLDLGLDKPQGKITTLHPRRNLCGGVDVQADAHSGVAAGEVAEHRRQHIDANGGAGTQAKLPAFERSHLFHGSLCFRQQIEDPLGEGKQHFALRGEKDAPVPHHEEARTKVPLEPAHVPAHCRLS